MLSDSLQDETQRRCTHCLHSDSPRPKQPELYLRQLEVWTSRLEEQEARARFWQLRNHHVTLTASETTRSELTTDEKKKCSLAQLMCDSS